MQGKGSVKTFFNSRKKEQRRNSAEEKGRGEDVTRFAGKAKKSESG